jgi:hypothetical protein
MTAPEINSGSLAMFAAFSIYVHKKEFSFPNFILVATAKRAPISESAMPSLGFQSDDAGRVRRSVPMLRKTMIALLTAAALTGGLTADAFARGDVAFARGDVGGMGMHGGAHAFPPRGHFHLAQQQHHHHRFFPGDPAFGLWPWYGYNDAPSDPYDDSSSTPQVVVPEPPAPACQHSEQTVTVPSENGGTAQVTILRC